MKKIKAAMISIRAKKKKNEVTTISTWKLFKVQIYKIWKILIRYW